MNFGKIISVPLRDMWPGEASDFTPWLGSNLQMLAEELGMDLVLESTEALAGDFSADIVARDISTNRLVVIENQYGSTDHKHLGQIITYSSVLGAGVVIWIAETIRQEHKSAIDFLNQNLKEGLQLYALEAGVIRIDDSKPAFSFNIVCMPTESAIVITTGEATETKEKYRAYFQGLIDELRTKHKFTNARAGQPQNWYAFSSENSKVFKYSAVFGQGDQVRVEIYLDCGDKVKNEALFDALLSNRNEIEASLGTELKWDKLLSKRACRIAVYRDGNVDADSEVLEEIKNWTIDNLLRFRRTFPKFIESAWTTVRAGSNGQTASEELGANGLIG